MASAIVSKLLAQLASFIGQQVEQGVSQVVAQQAEQGVRLVVGVEQEVRKLESYLRAVEGVLEDAERKQVKEASVKQWLDKLIEVSYDAEDVLDEWNTAILKQQIEKETENAPRKKRKVWFESLNLFNSCSRQVALRHDIAVKIKELNERLYVITKENHDFHFTLMRGNEKLERQMTASVIDVSKVQGRDQDKSKIIDMLLSESSQAPILRTISLVGMGGIGKTTLSQLVYNDDTVQTHFQKRIWVCVSDPFDEIRIAKAIIEELTGDAPNLNELHSLLGRIRHFIEGQKFLLVLDDVWTENSTKWELLKSSLICGSPGSRILVTTRKENVAIIMGTTDMFSLGTLSKEDCWSLFSQLAFFGRTSEECKKLEGISWEIVDKCKGLPLAAKTLGGLLRFKRTKEQWQSVLDSEVWKLPNAETHLFPPLLLSYYELPSVMRRCFSYCAIFSKDYQLGKDELIKLWMAQGYLKAIENEEMEMIGEECFENLAMCSFFQDFEKDVNGSIIKCKMHDIVHDFAQFLTKNECLVMEVVPSEEARIESSHEKARHLNLILSGEVSIPMSIYNLKNLRSLIVESRASPQFNFGLLKSFTQLTCLRSLDFSSCGLKELPGEIGKLIVLRYLKLLHNTELEVLPETVCELCNLQFLNVVCCSRLKQLPHGIGKLINLRHLEILGTSIKFMPKGIERLASLRTLDVFVVSDGDNDGEASALEDLKNLKHLQGELWLDELGNVTDVGEAEKAQLKNKEHLISLGLDFGEREVVGRMINDEQVIEAIQPPPNLEELSIYNYRGTSVFPNWMISLTNLKKIQLRFCMNCEFLPPLGKLWSLESLTIYHMESVKRVGIEFLGLESKVNKNDSNNEGVPLKKDPTTASSSSSVIVFPQLKQLRFEGMYNWEEWDNGMTRRMGEEEDITTATTIINIMPRLRYLQITDCPKLKSLPDHLLPSTSLEELEIWKCPILEERYSKERKGEDWPKISHIPNIFFYPYYVQKEGRLLQKPE